MLATPNMSGRALWVGSSSWAWRWVSPKMALIHRHTGSSHASPGGSGTACRARSSTTLPAVRCVSGCSSCWFTASSRLPTWRSDSRILSFDVMGWSENWAHTADRTLPCMPFSPSRRAISSDTDPTQWPKTWTERAPRHPQHLVDGAGPIQVGDVVDGELGVGRRQVDAGPVVEEPHVIALVEEELDQVGMDGRRQHRRRRHGEARRQHHRALVTRPGTGSTVSRRRGRPPRRATVRRGRTGERLSSSPERRRGRGRRAVEVGETGKRPSSLSAPP